MAEGSGEIAANGTSEDNCSGSCEAHHVRSRTQKDCGVPAGKVGKGESAAEAGCIAHTPKVASLNRNQTLFPT
jgi:hypothetical protein